VATERTTNGEIGELLDRPRYTQAETARLVGMSPSRIRRWLQGYEYEYEIEHGSVSVHGSQEPVVEPAKSQGVVYASFLDLVDLLFVKQFLEHEFSLQKVRLALDEVQQRLGVKHFAREDFFISGSEIFLRMKETEGENILALLTGGQWAIPDVIKQLGKKIDFHEATGLARRWYPLWPDKIVVIDPLVSFGRPAILGRGLATHNVYDFFKAENESLPIVCSWMQIKETEAQAAIQFEQKLAA
jgi:DNA-binding transcriptional MerR regulator/uncharacterized protein (DUF433 family)